MILSPDAAIAGWGNEIPAGCRVPGNGNGLFRARNIEPMNGHSRVKGIMGAVAGEALVRTLP